MSPVTLTKTGNAETLCVPKALRIARGFKPGDRFDAFSPYEGVVVYRRREHAVAPSAVEQALELFENLCPSSAPATIPTGQEAADVRATRALRGSQA